MGHEGTYIGDGVCAHPQRQKGMAKKDLSKELQELYFPPATEPVSVVVPEMGFISVEGQGDPNISKDFQDAIGALYSVAFTAKFTLKKKDKKRDFMVMPLEALWWSDSEDDFLKERKGVWKWKAMIMVPDHVKKEDIDDAIAQLKKKGKDLPALAKLRLGRWKEGRSAQIMHIGPYSAERPNIERIKKYIADGGHKARGKHHEIYLGDPRRAKPDKLKTVIRLPYG